MTFHYFQHLSHLKTEFNDVLQTLRDNETFKNDGFDLDLLQFNTFTCILFIGNPYVKEIQFVLWFVINKFIHDTSQNLRP